MQLSIISIGRFRHGIEYDLFSHYKRRINWQLNIKEIDDRKTRGQKHLEGNLLLTAVPNQAYMVTLDEQGRNVTSIEFAEQFRNWQNSGIKNVVFLIGGANGLSEEVKRQSNLSIAFGCVTWPHLLLRGMLMEQLYRAQQILAGHPYHRN